MAATKTSEPTYEQWKAFAKVRADALAAFDAEFGTASASEFNTAYAAGQAGAR